MEKINNYIGWFKRGQTYIRCENDNEREELYRYFFGDGCVKICCSGATLHYMQIDDTISCCSYVKDLPGRYPIVKFSDVLL